MARVLLTLRESGDWVRESTLLTRRDRFIVAYAPERDASIDAYRVFTSEHKIAVDAADPWSLRRHNSSHRSNPPAASMQTSPRAY